MSDDPTTSLPATPEPQPAVPAASVSVPPTAAPTWSAEAPLPPVQPVQPVVAAAKPRKSSSGRWLNVLLGVALAFAIGGVAFAIGRTTAPVSAATGGRGTFNGTFGGGANGPTGSFTPGANGGAFFGGRGGGLAISGTVKSVEGDQLTITTDNGQTVTLTTGDSTTYHTQAAASASDVTSGTKVSVKVSLTGRVNGQGNGGNGANGNGGTGNGNGGTGTGNGGTGNGATGPGGTASDVTIIP
jgi:hypothetical protein